VSKQPSTGEARLRREVGVVAACFVTVNAMIGTGIFRLAPTIVRESGGLSTAVSTWLLGGAVALAGALCMAEVGAALPRAGGIYEVLRAAYGAPFAFWFGWTRLWLLGPSAAGSFARLAAESAGALLGLAPDESRSTYVAAAVLIGCTLANLARVGLAAGGQAWLSALKLLGVVGLGAVCLLGPAAPVQEASVALPPATPLGLFVAFAAVMWAFDGWADVSALSGELAEPAKSLPIALCVGTLVVAVAYLLANLGYAHVLGEAGLAVGGPGTEMVAVRAAVRVLGDVGQKAISALVLVSCLGACLTGVLTGSRVFVSMASDGLAPRALGHVPTRSGVPVMAVMLSTALGVAYLSVRSFEQLTNGFVIGMFPFYTLAIAAVPVLRTKRPELPRPFRTPYAGVCVALFAVGACFVMLSALRSTDAFAAASLGVMAMGLPLGVLVGRRATSGCAP
jgi:basic amino acid/polyamine antiporter, APA family